MYGDLGNKLVLDAKRTANLSEVPVYQAELVKDIVKEVNELNQDVEYLTEQQQHGPSVSEEEDRINQCQLFVTHLSIRRNKRCLLAHQKLRADKMDEFSWLNIDPLTQAPTSAYAPGGRPAAPAVALDSSAYSSATTELSLDNLSHAEQEYFKNYQDLLIDYKSNFADIDLSGDLEPPKSIFIDVRVLKDGGEVQTEYGVFNLIKDSQFYVRKSDVDRLIQQGFLEEI